MGECKGNAKKFRWKKAMPHPDNSTNRLLTQQYIDGGPLYTESQYGQFVVEPYNAVTASLFLFLAIFWARRIHSGLLRNNKVIATIVLLAIGGIGGTLYHAFRMSRFFHLMDVLPIAIIGLGWSVEFLRRCFSLNYGTALVIDLILAVSGYFLLQQLPVQFAVTGTYIWLALLILVPLGWLLARERVGDSRFLKRCLLLFIVGLFFRVVDPWTGSYLPMGTHWLWHSFCFIAVHYWLLFVSSFQPSR
jgi:hypothetical protein